MPYVMLSLAAIFWGGNYVVGKIMVVNMDPILLSEFRWLLTSIILVIFNFLAIKENINLIIRNKKSIILLAILGQVMFPVALYIGLQYTTSLNAAIYLSSTPGLVLAFNWMFFRDYISKSNIVGVIISTLGVAWLVTKGDITNLQFLEKINRGDYWTMISAVSWAIYCSFLRKKPKEISGNVFVTACAIVGAIILIPFSLINIIYNGASLTFAPDFSNVLGMAYLVIFPSWLSYLFWSKGISIIGATRGEIFTHLIPLSAGVLSVIFLQVKLAQYHVVSIFAICIGVFLCSRHGKKPLSKIS
ncbi:MULTISPECIES: DMT family transporter [unclassified Escherichia]|uniref:DMT family transporter n=1 Tax=unclassified Escherichia TaxID=2608889 RepID=UPI0010292CB0|nr:MULTISPECIES: DMT family transporter [unclassified Escherichia]RZM90312.1 DMT family transporter [Escherichia sp. E1V33]TBR66086.1 DMT family transporter [Escherichia sp. E1S7]